MDLEDQHLQLSRCSSCLVNLIDERCCCSTFCLAPEGTRRMTLVTPARWRRAAELAWSRPTLRDPPSGLSDGPLLEGGWQGHGVAAVTFLPLHMQPPQTRYCSA